uniref:glutamate-rich protein 3 isoform X2 n=1 Tax=Pristiophorus japonicus TaxID=55135 RepID=UPI00398F5467
MSHTHPGPLATYNSLTDKHLTGYFNNTRIRRHLQRVGLVTRNGRIVSEREYRLNIVRKDHQKYVRESLAQAIFHKVLDMERHHQLEIKKRLEDFAKRERIQRIKVERARRSDEDIVPFLLPRPPTGPRNFPRSVSGPEVDRSDSSTSPVSPRPSTAPGKLQPPVRLLPLPGSGAPVGTTVITVQSSPHLRYKEQTPHPAEDTDPQLLHTLDRDSIRNWHTLDFPTGMSPYRLPVINNYVTPVPPPPRKREKNGSTRGRRLRPTTAPNGLVNLSAKDAPKLHRSTAHSNVLITMVYRGKRLHLSYDQARDEVKVQQQHCGGENLCVYKGKLLEAEKFQFVSRRHSGFPFSLTFFLNGIQVDRLSSCCEYKHRRGSRLGGKHAYFAFLDVDGASPCYRCIIAMGLDKKPTPPPKRMKEEAEKEGKPGSVTDEGEVSAARVPAPAGEGAGREEAMSAHASTEAQKTNEEEKMDEDKEERSPAVDTQRGNTKEEYDDDFEEEDEKPSEKAKATGEGRDVSAAEPPAAAGNERLGSDIERRSEMSEVREEEGSTSEEDSSLSSDSECASEEGRRSRVSLRSSSDSPRGSEESDGEAAGERERALAEDEPAHATAEEVGTAPGSPEQGGREPRAASDGERGDEKVPEGGASVEVAEEIAEQTGAVPAGEDGPASVTAGDTQGKAVSGREVEEGREANVSREIGGVEGTGGPVIAVEVHVRKPEDTALDVCAAELCESGRSAAGK